MSTSVQTSFLSDDAPEAAALARAAALRGTPGSFDELHGGPAGAVAAGAELAPTWKAFFDATGADGWVDLAQARARIRSRVQDDGVLPASLVLAHPQYLRAMHGCRPVGGVRLHVAAFDLARDPEGDWRVVS